MVNANWPLTVTSVAFSTDPFDGAATPTFVDLSLRCWEFSAAVGRQYELDIVQAGDASFVFSDKDEVLNPTNPAGTYYPNVVPYRQIIDQAMWPPAPVGAATNLLPGQLTPVIDPSFESYTNGQSLPVILTSGSGVAPTVTTTNPQQGTKCLTYNVTSGAGTSGVGVTVACIPGQQYTSSFYVRQTAVNTTQVFINGGASGTSTAATGAYVRLSVTWTATRPTHQMWVASFTTSNSGTVNVDALQHEPGGAATTFATSGPVIYGNFGGFVERWPSKWNHYGLYGVCEVNAVDGFAILAGQFLGTEVRNSTLGKLPDFYWPLSEPQGATTFAEVSGHGGPSLTRYDTVGGTGANCEPGTATNISGDPSGTGVKLTTSPGPTQTSILQTGFATASSFSAPALTTTVACWVTRGPTTTGKSTQLWALGLTKSIVTIPPGWAWLQSVDQGGGVIDLTLFYRAGSTNGLAVLISDVWQDNLPHLYVATFSVVANTVTGTLYIDGAQVGTGSLALTGTPVYGWDLLELGALVSPVVRGPGTYNTNPNTYAHFALWNRILSNVELADLWNAGQGYPNENSGARVTRYLSYNWVGGTAIDTGQSSMGVSDLANDTSVLDAILNVTLTEGGLSFVDDTGTITFFSRNRRFTNTTAKWAFGEAESPYQPDIAYDYDPTLIFNDTAVTRSGGVTAVGGTFTTRQASWKKYGKRSYSATINVASDLETQDRADWVFFTHKDPLQRIASLTLKPSANPALWPVCLGLSLGDRAIVKRRTTAGYTMSSDYFIERIEQHRSPTEWTFSFQLSPAPASGQPLILNNATYGTLDAWPLGY